jgi:phage baseplate assembly protein W
MDLIGSGLSFPMRTDPRGGLALASGPDDVSQAIRIILGTTPGERPMRPEFGCGLSDFLFESLDSAAIGRLREEVIAALERWEPRIDVLDVTCQLGSGHDGVVLLDIAYALVSTNAVHNLVYPFYVVPAEPE